MTRAEQDIIDRRRDYRDWKVFKRRHYVTWRVKPGCVWHWRGSTPWWADHHKLRETGEERQLNSKGAPL